ncbi:MAG TPA: GGDEF domain-containing protein [Arcobacter sp.]|nr:GGDEF domain-containing protein [Arcobacter sp.]
MKDLYIIVHIFIKKVIMTFNILIISIDNTLNKFALLTNSLENKKLFLINNKEKINSIFNNSDIHLVILDETILSLDEFEDIAKSSSSFDFYNPVLVLNNFMCDFSSNSLLIYDSIDINNNLHLASNKIKFCHSQFTKELKHQKNIQELLYVNNLTKLPNRLKLIQDLQNDDIGIISLAILDINSFKEVNDFFGHKIGDNILKEITAIASNIINKQSAYISIYKLPSDLYGITNSSLNDDDFKTLVLEINEKLESNVFYKDSFDIELTITSGITFSRKNNKLITADLALQEAKKEHKNYLIFYDELDNIKDYKKNMIWTKKLKKALSFDNIIVYFQPLVNNTTMKVDKYECLVRMVDDDKIISPFFFLDISKKANQYSKITKIVIEKSFKEFNNLPFEFSINISYEDIEDENFITYIKEKLKKYPVAKKIVWEILEDESIKDYQVLYDFIKEMKALGSKIAIDDFGSGYSNFEHLLKMDIDYLKIDASLVKDVAKNKNSFQVVKTIIEFANSLNLKTIAEYVENKEIFEITRDMGVTYSQGYYFAPPLCKPNVYTYEE